MNPLTEHDSPPSQKDHATLMSNMDSLIRHRLMNGSNLPRQLGLNDCKTWACNRIKTQHATALKVESGDYTTEERDTWQTQYQSAKDFIANKADDADKRMLDRLCRDGETKTVLSRKIIGKHAAGKELIGIAGKVKRDAKDAVNAATSVDGIEVAMHKAAKEMHQAIADFKKQMAAASA